MVWWIDTHVALKLHRIKVGKSDGKIKLLIKSAFNFLCFFRKPKWRTTTHRCPLFKRCEGA